MGPDNYPEQQIGVGALKSESPVSKGFNSLEKAQHVLSEAIQHLSSRLQPILTPEGTVEGKPQGVDPMAPTSDLARELSTRADAFYRLAQQVERLTNRIEL